jgi:outer membrane protein TolC
VSGNISYSAPTSANLFEKQYGNWSVGPTVSWNLFNAGKTYYNVKLQEAVTREAGISWNQVVLESLKEVEDVLVASANEKQRVEKLKELVQLNERAFNEEIVFYKAGLGAFMDVLDSQRTMLSSQQNLVESRRLILDNMINLYKALGGGWLPEDLHDQEYEDDMFLLF